MQTFLPSPDFQESARMLDYRRLGKQRVEAYQLLRGGWPNHPAARMWSLWKGALYWYAECICVEWIRRGYRDTVLAKIQIFKSKVVYPVWLGNELFHSRHRAALLFKDYQWYSQFGWKEAPVINYYWPM